MANYLITYLGGRPPASKEEGMAHMAKYKAWLAELGDAAVSPANPLSRTHSIASDGTVTEGGSTMMSGYTIVAADSLDEALRLAGECPFLDIGGTLEVSEMMKMPF